MNFLRTSPLQTEPSASSTAIRGWWLPLFITQRNKWFVGPLLAAIAVFLYLSSNHIHVFEPQMLPMWWIDRSVPFVPQTVLIYASEYLLFFVVYAMCKDVLNANKYAYSFCMLQVFSVMIFWIWPTTYPRELFPLPTGLDPITHWVFSTLRATDSPANCCPSLHVSSVYLSSFVFRDEQREKFPFFFLWATAIGLSTLTTKQHYAIDVVTGLFMAVLFHWIFHRFFNYRPMRSAAP
jgi:hypothetical protein